LEQGHQGRGLLTTKWHLDPSSRLATIDMDRGLYGRMQRYGRRPSLRPEISKVGGIAVALSVGTSVPFQHNVA